MASIELRNLSHSYDGLTNAIESLNHLWPQGGAYALLGPSGCGKSTLLNIISGLVSPSEGQVLFEDNVVNGDSPQQRNIAQVFQFPVVYDAMTVRENLAFPLKNMKLDKLHIQQKVMEIAELLDLQSSLDKKAKSLTADEKQKISMGRGLVREDVSAILFDEPLTVIDPHLKWKLRRKLKEIHEKLNVTMIYVTHDQLEAATFADEIAVMYQGKIVQFGTPQSLFEQPNHTFVGYFIGSPGMNFVQVNKNQNEVVANDLAFNLSTTQKNALAASDTSNIKLGIRPEFIKLANQATANSYPVDILSVESFGAFKIVEVRFADETWFVRVGEFDQFDATPHYMTFEPTRLKLYLDDYLAGEETDFE